MLVDAFVVFCVAAPSCAAADSVQLVRLSQVSHTPALAPSCLNPSDGPPSSDVEPYVAVNPTHPNNIIATWWIGQENFGERAKAGGVAYTLDGGRTWHTSLIRGVDACTGGPADFTNGAHDPWVSFGPDGRAYLVVYSFSSSLNTDWVLTSSDGGRSWSGPVRAQQGACCDKPSITADPRRPGMAYLVSEANDGVRGTASFLRTEDGGRSWSTAQQVYASQSAIPIANQIVVTPGGTLVDVFDDLKVTSAVPGAANVPSNVTAIRSTDGGQTWSQPIVIALHGDAFTFMQPDGSAIMTLTAYPSAAISRDGKLYVAWGDPNDAGALTGLVASRVYVAHSSDGGATWSHPVAVGSSQAFSPSLGVAGDGTVGVSYYDLSADRRGDSEWTARVMFAHSADGGATWQERQLGGHFDLAQAPQVPLQGPFHSGFLGDYFGVAGTPDGFAAAFVMAKPQATEGRSDAFVAQLGPGGAAAGAAHAELPPNAGCLRRGRFVFRVRLRRGARLLRATVFIRGRQVPVRLGRAVPSRSGLRLRAVVDLAGLRAGEQVTIQVRLRVRLRGRTRTLRVTRTYRACAPRRNVSAH